MEKKQGNEFPKAAYIIVLLLHCMLALTSCHTKPETGDVNGMVSLVNDTADLANDPWDNSSVTVALYELAELDTTLLRINAEYPQVGIQISQETEFDHRNADPIVLTYSDAVGHFLFKGIDPGTYNLVYLKEGWGLAYRYGIKVTRGEITNLDTCELYPAQDFSFTVSEEVVFKTDHCYCINGITNFIGNIEMEPQARIYGEPGAIIRFYGNVTTSSSEKNENAWRIASSESIYTAARRELDTGDFMTVIEFHGTDLDINNGIISHISNSVAFLGNSCDFSYSIVRFCGGGISIPLGSANISNVIVMEGTNYGINLASNSTEPSQVVNSIIGRMGDGISVRVIGSYSISNCYFFSNNNAIWPDNCVGSIIHNAFENNTKDIYQRFVYWPTEIQYNNFYNSLDIGIWPHARANIANNNFYRTGGYYITIRGPNPPEYSLVRQDLIAINNYWGLPNYEDYLLDGNDNANYPGQSCPYYIISVPKRTIPVSNAGIQ